jgi:hypothetical protein
MIENAGGTMTLTEFLLARIGDEETEARDEWLHEYSDVPREVAVDAWDHLTDTAFLRFNIACRRLGVALMAALPMLGDKYLRQRARRYAGHPDYQIDWRP